MPVGDGLETAITVVSSGEAVGTVLFCFPGGGYNRRYYDLPLAGGYSQAAWHAERGWTVVCCDHLGVGDSSLADPETLTFDRLAAANDATVAAVVDRLEPTGPLLGAGQSMGGFLLVVQQARHRSFAGIAVLGCSAVHIQLPRPDGVLDLPAGLDEEEVAERLMGAITAYGFHLPDVPAEIVAEDLTGYPLRTGGVVPAWSSTTAPPCAMNMLTPGILAEDAAAVDVPVLVVAGEVDVNMNLDAERSAYRAAPSVDTSRLEGSAHMHNFASSRQRLWDRIHRWGGENVR